MTDKPLRLGISACLLGKPVRFDGGHKRDPYVNNVLGAYVEWVSVCPEVGAGFGTPRETLRLVGDASAPRLVTNKTREDCTAAMQAYVHKEVQRLAQQQLMGFVFKSKSPSCGMERVKVYNANNGMPEKAGTGLFARALMDALPLLPVEEEGRLHDPLLREQFVEAVFGYQRWLEFCNAKPTRGGLVTFHAAHKYLILAHSPKHYTAMGHLVADLKAHGLADTLREYGQALMQALRVRATVRKHTNVLQHMAGFFKKEIEAPARAELAEVIDEYHRGLVPLVVPLTLIRHYVRALDVQYLRDQIYLQPTPKELMLRNHV